MPTAEVTARGGGAVRTAQHRNPGPTVPATNRARGATIMRPGPTVANTAPAVTGASMARAAEPAATGVGAAACILVPAAGAGAAAREVSASGR